MEEKLPLDNRKLEQLKVDLLAQVLVEVLANADLLHFLLQKYHEYDSESLKAARKESLHRKRKILNDYLYAEYGESVVDGLNRLFEDDQNGKKPD